MKLRACLFLCLLPWLPAPVLGDNPLYTFKEDRHPDGIGKIYFGREISQVMGHLAAGWLERPEREAEEAPARLLDALGLRPGMSVADIGAGSGYFTRRIARRIGPGGVVHAVEIQQEMLDILEKGMKEAELSNYRTVLGTVTDPGLEAESVDLALMVDVYHEFSHPHEMMLAIVRSLRPQGRVAFVEYRGEDPRVPIKPLHKMTRAQILKEAGAQGLELVESHDVLPRQHVLIFGRAQEEARPEAGRAP